MGNRAVEADPWAVIQAMEHAYTLVLSPAVTLARSCAGADTCRLSAPEAWAQLVCFAVARAKSRFADIKHVSSVQAVADGSLLVLVDKVRSQPQVYTAYRPSAALRCREMVMELLAALRPLQVHPLMGRSNTNTDDSNASSKTSCRAANLWRPGCWLAEGSMQLRCGGRRQCISRQSTPRPGRRC